MRLFPGGQDQVARPVVVILNIRIMDVPVNDSLSISESVVSATCKSEVRHSVAAAAPGLLEEASVPSLQSPWQQSVAVQEAGSQAEQGGLVAPLVLVGLCTGCHSYRAAVCCSCTAVVPSVSISADW